MRGRAHSLTVLLIGGLTALVGYLALRLRSTNADNETLRADVASLKRQLVKRRS
jgi:hypothetical protein